MRLMTVISDNYKEAQRKLLSAINDVDMARANMIKPTRAYFKEEYLKIFDKYPELESFGWHQYTPYFNDGDECVFGVSDDEESLTINGTEYYEIYTWDSRTDSHVRDPKWEPLDNAWEEISQFLRQFEDETMEALFGDHVEITVDRDGATVNHYNHD